MRVNTFYERRVNFKRKKKSYHSTTWNMRSSHQNLEFRIGENTIFSTIESLYRVWIHFISFCFILIDTFAMLSFRSSFPILLSRYLCKVGYDIREREENKRDKESNMVVHWYVSIFHVALRVQISKLEVRETIF